MKSRIAICLFAAMVVAGSLALGGCDGVPESDPISTPSSDNTNNMDNSGDTQSDTQTPAVSLDSETQKLIDKFPLDTFVGFDGKEVKKTDAVGRCRDA